MSIVFELPMLYGEAQTGKIKIYKVSVVDNGDGSFSVMREHGQQGGKTQIDEKRVATGKNIGKANETTPKDQAIAEAKSYWQKKLDSNYSENPDQTAPKENLLPMLAHPYKDYGHRMQFPCGGQVKLNGVRCLARRTGDTINFTSRKGKSYNETLQHLVPELLQKLPDGEVFDGEIYIHGKSLQTIVSYVKKLRPESKQLQYWIYDLAKTGIPCEERAAQYQTLIKDNPMDFLDVDTEVEEDFVIEEHSDTPKVFALPCIEINSPDDIKAAHDKAVQDGFEGLILRNKKGEYTFDHRSADLQKYKEFIDEEFEIIGGRTPDTGRYAGGCIFLCKTKGGGEFEVTPRGSVHIRKKYYKDLPKLIGKQLTVRYQNLSDAGIPIFPVGIVVRDYE